MDGARVFFDTSVLLYLLSSDRSKADRVEALLEHSGSVSVQVLNEFASVATGKLKMSFTEVREVLDTVRRVCSTQSLVVEDHDRALAISERYRFSFHDALIIASALRAGCRMLYCEDMQHRQVIERQLRIVNPFGVP